MKQPSERTDREEYIHIKPAKLTASHLNVKFDNTITILGSTGLPLDVWIYPPGAKSSRDPGSRRVCSIEPEGEFNWLSQFFDTLFGLTGKNVDPYDGAQFLEQECDALERVTTDAATALAAMPDSWSQWTGTYLSEPPEDVYVTVSKSAISSIVAGLEYAIAEARTGSAILFVGD